MGGFNLISESAKRHVGRGKATRLLGGFGGMLPGENF